MGLNKSDRAEIERAAKAKGFTWNSSGTAMQKSNSTLKFSDTGESVRLKNSRYNSAADLKKSKNW